MVTNTKQLFTYDQCPYIGKCEDIPYNIDKIYKDEEIHAHIAHYLATDFKHFVLCSLQETSWTSCGIPHAPSQCAICQEEILSQLHLTKRYMPNCMENQKKGAKLCKPFR
ncbi:hypothetical protein GDO78_003791 [Eleutherodactylus coqui]|uniref:Uncharacterized protein n=1 Tax=Eleutherodactylus coqui TaxID=57060 RepID=A0A8J6EVP3_ELECQ|nr:hypothetical protein GDO78_003791 [Eleutherodactylus coqui]